MSLKKDIERYVVALRYEGWTVERTTSGHWKLTHTASGGTVTASSTPSCRYALKNINGDVHRVVRRWEETQPKVAQIKPEDPKKVTLAHTMTPELKNKLLQMAEPKKDFVPQPRSVVVEPWKPRPDETEKEQHSMAQTNISNRTFKKRPLRHLEAWRAICGMNDITLSQSLGYSTSTLAGWKDEGEMPEVAANLCDALVEIHDLKKMLDEATKPKKMLSDIAGLTPLDFIKEGLKVLNNAIKGNGLKAHIKEDGTIGAQVITTVEL